MIGHIVRHQCKKTRSFWDAFDIVSIFQYKFECVSTKQLCQMDWLMLARKSLMTKPWPVKRHGCENSFLPSIKRIRFFFIKRLELFNSNEAISILILKYLWRDDGTKFYLPIFLKVAISLSSISVWNSVRHSSFSLIWSLEMHVSINGIKCSLTDTFL